METRFLPYRSRVAPLRLHFPRKGMETLVKCPFLNFIRKRLRLHFPRKGMETKSRVGGYDHTNMGYAYTSPARGWKPTAEAIGANALKGYAYTSPARGWKLY